MELRKTIAFMKAKHAGQLDLEGKPYWEHPYRVMLAATSDEGRIVGLLHDVLEDTPTTAADLRAEGFSNAVVEAVEVLTKSGKDTYATYIDRIVASGNELAIRIKIADCTDNMRGNFPSRRKRYARTIEKLERALPK